MAYEKLGLKIFGNLNNLQYAKNSLVCLCKRSHFVHITCGEKEGVKNLEIVQIFQKLLYAMLFLRISCEIRMKFGKKGLEIVGNLIQNEVNNF